MAKIVDPDDLSQSTQPSSGTEDGEVYIDKDAKTIELIVFGNLDDTSPGRTSGAAGQAVYSFFKEEWRTDATLNVLRFPFNPIFEQKLVLQEGWKWLNAQTRDLLRDVGWAEIDGSETAGLQSLGDDFPTEQAYYQQVFGFDNTAYTSVADFDKTGAVNEGVQIKGAGGTPDYTGFLKIFLREQGKTYSQGELVADQALSAIDYRFYGAPLENAVDIDITETDGNIDGNTPYTNMDVDYLLGTTFDTAAATTYVADEVLQDGAGRWFFVVTGGTVDSSGAADYTSNGGTATLEAYAGEVQIGANYYAFNRIIDCATGTKGEAYNWLMRQLRKTTNINDDTLGSPNQNGSGDQYGRIANELGYFVGTTLHSAPGVAYTNFDANDTNDIRQHDITVDSGGLDTEGLPVVSTQRSYPFLAAGNMVFSDNLVAEPDADTIYKMIFEYIIRETNTDVALTSSSGADTTMTSTAIDLSQWAAGEFMYVQGFTGTATNNGMYVATGTPAANSIDLTKVDGVTVVDEVSGDTVTLDLEPYDSPDAVIVKDNSSTDITGQITAKTIAFDFDYTNNAQNGRTPNVDAPIWIVAMGKAGARWIDASFTILEATGQNFPVNAAEELVYSNP